MNFNDYNLVVKSTGPLTGGTFVSKRNYAIKT